MGGVPYNINFQKISLGQLTKCKSKYLFFKLSFKKKLAKLSYAAANVKKKSVF